MYKAFRTVFGHEALKTIVVVVVIDDKDYTLLLDTVVAGKTMLSSRVEITQEVAEKYIESGKMEQLEFLPGTFNE